MSEFSLEIGTDGIAIVKWDLPNKTLNVLTLKGIEELENIVDELLSTKKVKGVVITSGKKDFAAGMDLNVLADLQANTMNQKNEKIFEFIIRVYFKRIAIIHFTISTKMIYCIYMCMRITMIFYLENISSSFLS